MDIVTKHDVVLLQCEVPSAVTGYTYTLDGVLALIERQTNEEIPLLGELGGLHAPIPEDLYTINPVRVSHTITNLRVELVDGVQCIVGDVNTLKTPYGWFADQLIIDDVDTIFIPRGYVHECIDQVVTRPDSVVIDMMCPDPESKNTDN
jgi:hypothetical protein